MRAFRPTTTIIFVGLLFCLVFLPVTAKAEEAVTCSMSSDYTALTLSAPASEEDAGEAVFTVDDGSSVLSWPATRTYDGLWMTTEKLPDELFDTELQIHLTAGSQMIAAASVCIPRLDVGTTPLPGLAVHLNDGLLTLRPQEAGALPYFFLPSGTDLSALVFSFDDTVSDVTICPGPGGTPQPLADGSAVDLTVVPDGFTACDALFLTFSFMQDGSQNSYTVGLMCSANLHAVFFTSDDPDEKGRLYIDGSEDHSAKANGTFDLYDSALSRLYSGAKTQIKGRGNTTWIPDKKPYQIKLDKKADLLDPVGGSQKAKKWILLANYYDPTLLHNAVAFDLAYTSGLTATPQGYFVDFYYDGEYRGNYYLC